MCCYLLDASQFFINKNFRSNIECCTSCQPSKKEWNHILLIACSEGYTQLCELIVKSGSTDLELFDEDKITNPLIAAVKSFNFYLVQLLVDNKVMINATNKLYKTALHYASESNYQEIIQYLIEKGANILASDHDGLSPLEIILKKNTNMKNEENIENLAKSSNIHFLFGSKNNLLSSAVEAKYFETITKEEINTIIIDSIKEHKIKCCLVLLDNFPLQNDLDGKMVLNFACRMGKFELIKRIVEIGVNPTIYDFQSIFESCTDEFVSIVKYLLKNESLRPHISIKNLEMALLTSSEYGFFNAVHYLVSRNININCKDDNGHTPLYKAATKGHLTIVKFLVEKNADINNELMKIDLKSPLHIACQNGHGEVVDFLLHSLFTQNAKCQNVSTLLLDAVTAGQSEVVFVLLRWASNFTSNNDQNLNKKQDLPLLMDKDEIKNLKSSPSNSSEHNTDEKLCDEVNKILKGSMFAHMREKCLKYIKNDPSLLRKIKDLNILQYTAEEKLNDIKMSCLANDIAGCQVETTTDPYNDGIRQKANSLKSQHLEKFDDNSLDISPSIYSLKEISKSAAGKKKTRLNQKDKNITLKNISSHISVSGVETGGSNMNTAVFEENIKNSYLFDNHTNKAVYHSLVGEM
ncbi:MAG: Ankyrin repeat domain-containing protein 17 [Paramarteilia canceri]